MKPGFFITYPLILRDEGRDDPHDGPYERGGLSVVVGAEYAGVSAYVSGVRYRAWGAPKSYRHGGR